MTAEAISSPLKCRNCGAGLSLEELHYYDDPERGGASCDKCNGAWLVAIQEWLAGKGSDDDFPKVP